VGVSNKYGKMTLNEWELLIKKPLKPHTCNIALAFSLCNFNKDAKNRHTANYRWEFLITSKNNRWELLVIGQKANRWELLIITR